MHIKGTKRYPPVQKSNAEPHQLNNRNQMTQNTDTTKSTIPDHFLGVISLLKQEILETLNQKMDTIQSQVQDLQQAQHFSPPQITNPLSIFRPQIQIPQQPFNPIQTYQQ